MITEAELNAVLAPYDARVAMIEPLLNGDQLITIGITATGKRPWVALLLGMKQDVAAFIGWNVVERLKEVGVNEFELTLRYIK